MEEIKTKIDEVFELIQKKRMTTAREVSKTVKIDKRSLTSTYTCCVDMV
ncbi:MAG: hypothetical protein QXF56_04590 [Candidatus Micrarchaeia archaeon]